MNKPHSIIYFSMTKIPYVLLALNGDKFAVLNNSEVMINFGAPLSLSALPAV